jgi:DNA excision repair protein ERCC-3
MLSAFAKYPVPSVVLSEIHEQMGRHGRLRIVRDFDSGGLALTTHEPAILEEVVRDRTLADLVGARLDGNRYAIRIGDRGSVKQALIRLGWPAADEAGYTEGATLEFGLTCDVRTYQAEAVEAWWTDGSAAGGNGALVLPCGAGKTVIGIAAMAQVGAHCLIVATSITAARQWISELVDKTDIDESLIGEYSGERKQIRPITVATYQVLTWAESGSSEESDVFLRHPHLALFDRTQWGLVIYDEVHLLPAPVFRATARIQAVRRLGLTATLIREDGKQADVFSLIGPKRYDAPWRDLEAQGWIAPATCTEIRVDMSSERRMDYAVARQSERYRLAATAPEKIPVVEELIARHPGERILVIGQYLDQLRIVSDDLSAPSSPDRHHSGSAMSVSPPFGTGRSRCWWFRRSQTSPSTSPRRASESKSRARLVADRKRRNAWPTAATEDRRTPGVLLHRCDPRDGGPDLRGQQAEIP